MSHSDNYSTLEDYIRSIQSPGLERTVLDFSDHDTPPPLVNITDTSEPSESDADVEGELRLPSKGTKGPDYPDIATQAGSQILTDSPEIPCEDFTPTTVDELPQMIAVEVGNDGSRTSTHPFQGQALQASRKASEMLNYAIGNPRLPSLSDSLSLKGGVEEKIMEIHNDDEFIQHSKPVESSPVNGEVKSSPSPDASSEGAQRPLNVIPPPKPSLPNLITENPQSKAATPKESTDSLSKSPTLAKFQIQDGHPSQTLARIHNHSTSQSSTGSSPETKQILPSLETALSSITDSNGTPFSDPSPSLSALTRPSPGTYSSHIGPSPVAYTQPSPMSPPRLSSNPSFYRTTSHNSSVSTTAEYASAHSTTSASSVPGHSPSAHSMHTPIPSPFDRESLTDLDLPRGLTSNSLSQEPHSNGYSEQGYRCPWPGCHAAPFQTQYLLNSHTNVHSNTRSHFCPVQGCPRGPGGQGFKRKNEMIRHGLVHQSPGYVCPFCHDQQHRYPRPDNLQRHVRVHHPDRDRDDTLLREVLAQRPEGGNRGRRRRLGS